MINICFSSQTLIVFNFPSIFAKRQSGGLKSFHLNEMRDDCKNRPAV